MNYDRSLARCSFCGQRPPEVRRMVAGPGAAYICEACLQLCNEIMSDPTPFSAKALELASRPPVVIAAPQSLPLDAPSVSRQRPLRTMTLEIEQKHRDMTLFLHQMQWYEEHFELHYIWMRPPLAAGFAFVPRLIFFLRDDTGMRWAGDRGGILLARPELAGDANSAVYQGSARFRPLPSSNAHRLIVQAADPLGQFEDPPLEPWRFEIGLY
ncbi:MAG TPA: ClpX C4-type zinc finger protein [Ktedonobacteraceae bacterium]|nr:ClpX C4-type zinc finger protein [Ktedonobacteraceae bacterium]